MQSVFLCISYAFTQTNADRRNHSKKTEREIANEIVFPKYTTTESFSYMPFQDRHTVGHSMPLIDKSQDWHLLYGEENEFGTILKFVRQINTCDDTEDMKITVCILLID